MREAIAEFLEYPAVSLVFSTLEFVGSAAFAFVGAALGMRGGLHAFRKTEDAKQTEAREFRRWERRRAMAIDEGLRSKTKDFLNSLTAKLATNEGLADPNALLQEFPADVRDGIARDPSGEAETVFNRLKELLGELIEMRLRGTHGNNSSYVTTFTEAKLQWTFLFDLIFAEPLSMRELADLSAMGIVPRDRVGSPGNSHGAEPLLRRR
ncbi:MAG: hypothetical protein V2I43_20760 [Parvularcula sp.]|jgi:hypothetical protein|nr:hypothetical protein [Parvularcula sp.]